MSTERKGYHGPDVFDGKSQLDSSVRPTWFTEHIETIPDVGRQLLEEYSGISHEEVLPHVIAIVSNISTCISQLSSPPHKGAGSTLENLKNFWLIQLQDSQRKTRLLQFLSHNKRSSCLLVALRFGIYSCISTKSCISATPNFPIILSSRRCSSEDLLT